MRARACFFSPGGVERRECHGRSTMAGFERTRCHGINRLDDGFLGVYGKSETLGAV